MGSSPRFLLAAVWIASLTLLFPSAHAQKAREPLTEGEVMRLLQGGVPPQRVEKLARDSGIAFEMNVAVERDLRSAGASDQLLQTLRELAPGKGPAKPKTETPKTGATAPTGILLIIVDAACKLAVDGEDSGELAAGASKRLTLPFGEHLIRAVSNDEPTASVEWTGKVERPEQSLVRLELASRVKDVGYTRERAVEDERKAAEEERIKSAFAMFIGRWKRDGAQHYSLNCVFTYNEVIEFRWAGLLGPSLSAEKNVERESMTAIPQKAGDRYYCMNDLSDWPEYYRLILGEQDGSCNLYFSPPQGPLGGKPWTVPIRIISPTTFECSYTFEGKNYKYVFTKVAP